MEYEEVQPVSEPIQLTPSESVTHPTPQVSIETDGSFATAIRDIIRERKPVHLLETGTHRGTGSTAVICGAIGNNSRLHTVESNRTFFGCAVANTHKWNYRVECRWGLSIPRSLLPTYKEVLENIRSCPADIAIDGAHLPSDELRAQEYVEETTVRGSAPENLIKQIVKTEHDGKIDFVLLDSAGHIGYIEFQHLLNFLEHPCIIALDDTKHLKHYKSIVAIRRWDKFKILAEGQDRCGWAITEYRP